MEAGNRMEIHINMPDDVVNIIDKLAETGQEAYAVGGCVRDAILGRNPDDWDITTSAKPFEVKKVFKRTIDTGILHGTVTVMQKGQGYEVTTYRIDGEYEDSRHPKNVEFTGNLIEDLKRRDFTINAMAYNHTVGIVDEFHGLEDIQSKMIRCVGKAEERFDEDALRILRAVRFSAQLGFEIEEDTRKAICQKAEHLKNISAERIRVELDKLLVSKNPNKLFDAYKLGITKVVFPELDKMFETAQNNPHHIYNVGEHSIRSAAVISPDAVTNLYDETKEREKYYHILRWTMLLHDVAKPECRIVSADGIEHFYGHPEASAETARKILRRLKFDNITIDTATRLIKWHDYEFSLKPASLRRAANKIGKDIIPLLFEVKYADIMAQNPDTQRNKLEHLRAVREIYQGILSREECITLKDLKITGRDLIENGFRPGKELGTILSRLLTMVLEQPELNKKEILISIALTL